MKKIGFRVAIIGACHIFLYLFLVPRVILPRYGTQGAVAAGVAVVGICLIIPAGAGWYKKNSKK